jgi:hypothetical protein
MPRKRKETESAASTTTAPEERQPGDEPAEQPTKKWTPAADPFGTHLIKAGENSIRLLKSTQDRAWLIRFEKNPNEGRAKDDPHPVLAYLKSEGFRWADSQADGKKAWGKEWQDGRYLVAEHMDAEKVFKKAADMLGPIQSQGVPF